MAHYTRRLTDTIRGNVVAEELAATAFIGYFCLVKTISLSAVLNPEDDGYVSLCPELDIASQGGTVDEALANLKEALEGFFETASAEEVKARLKKPALFTRIEVECA